MVCVVAMMPKVAVKGEERVGLVVKRRSSYDEWGSEVLYWLPLLHLHAIFDSVTGLCQYPHQVSLFAKILPHHLQIPDSWGLRTPKSPKILQKNERPLREDVPLLYS